MQRSMSYRKPVPTYIPSPPSSPRQSTLPNLDGEVPPLPANWREVLNQVGMMLPPRLNAKSKQLYSGEHIEMDMPKGSNLSVHEDEVASTAGTRSTSISPQKRRLHQQYRPPTPPIPSHHKPQQSLLNPDNLNSDVTMPPHVHPVDHFGLYHDYPRGGPGVSSLKISSSFRTDKTMGSFNTSNTGGLSNSSLLNHERVRDLHKIAGDTSESVVPSCWESLGAWAKKLWNFVIISK